MTEDDSCLYQYDLDGNMTEKIGKAAGDTTIFTYNIENKLVQVKKSGMLAKYSYDALGRRMCKEVNGEVKQFRYDRQELILEMNGSGSIIANYTFGIGIDNPLSMKRNGNNYYYMKDGLGSVTALADNNGEVKHEYKYGAFGRIVEENGDTIENKFTYTSRELDVETGNYFYRARYFHPVTGRFICEDPFGPMGGNLNFYCYVRNNTINARDPMGLFELGGNISDCNGGQVSTIMCDGNGGITERIGDPGPGGNCNKGCMKEHERSHKNDALKANKTICQGQPYGTIVTPSDPQERAESEMRAYFNQIKCMESQLKELEKCDPENCKTKVKDQIQFIKSLTFEEMVGGSQNYNFWEWLLR